MAWLDGASAVPISENVLLTAKHIGARLGSRVTINDETFLVDRVINHPKADLTIVRVKGTLPLWYPWAAQVRKGDRIVIGGTGKLTFIQDDLFVWSSLRAEKWGENEVLSANRKRGVIMVRLDRPKFKKNGDVHPKSQALDHEAIVSGGDSGGGFFIEQGGQLRLVGITIFVTGPRGAARWGSVATALDVSRYADFINDAIDAFEDSPITFGAADELIPVHAPGPGAVALAIPAACMCLRRRRA